MIQPYDLPIDKSHLWNIYNRCNRKEKYYNYNIASTTNVFIDDPNDIEYINNNIINPLGLGADKIYIPVDLISNRWDDGPWDNGPGFNFNVVEPGGFVKPHCDLNTCKINILLNDTTLAPFHSIATDEKYYYEHPVLLDVSQLHTIDNCESIVEDRVTLQLFLTADYEKCERIINENRTY